MSVEEIGLATGPSTVVAAEETGPLSVLLSLLDDTLEAVSVVPTVGEVSLTGCVRDAKDAIEVKAVVPETGWSSVVAILPVST